MPTVNARSTADLLLEVLERLSLGPASRAEIVRRLRRAHPFSGVARRAAELISSLEGEGLIERDDSGAGEPRYRTTGDGLAALQARGRLPVEAVVLFTDLVNSTELISRLGESEAHACRRRHFGLLRDAIAATGGCEVKNLGDGLMVVFADAGAAVECARRMQRDVAADPDGLGLRVGLHAGETLREGDDYFGATVVTAGRLCDSAQSGQILISDRALEAAGDAAVAREPLGSLRLKGLKRSVPAWSLR